METLAVDIGVGLRSYPLNVRLDVGAERIALVGPSGAGKTTVLRSIAGLLRPERGRIAFGDDVWFDADRGVCRDPDRRSVGLVFQEYALFPHLTVRGNVAFGGPERADELLERFGIAHLGNARPDAISGGERQRVALARALARDPSVLLLDEPLSALDAQTRSVVRAELQELLDDLELPALVVTHDFRDAAALADRVGVIVDGRLRQEGSPRELLDAPADAFVARFTGANVLAGEATPHPAGGATVALDSGGTVRLAQVATGRVGLAVHPWQLELLAQPPGDDRNVIAGTVAGVTPEGGRLRVRLGPVEVEVPADGGPGPSRGSLMYATFDPAVTHVLPAPGDDTAA